MVNALKFLNILTLTHIVLGAIFGLNKIFEVTAIATVIINLLLFTYDELRSR